MNPELVKSTRTFPDRRVTARLLTLLLSTAALARLATASIAIVKRRRAKDRAALALNALGDAGELTC